MRIFNKIVEATRNKGLVGDRLHTIDSRHLKANVSTWRKRDRNTDGDAGRPGGFERFDDSPAGGKDPDAAWGRKSKNHSFFGYKHHLAVDADSGIITQTVVTPCNEHDGVVMAAVLDEAASVRSGGWLTKPMICLVTTTF